MNAQTQTDLLDEQITGIVQSQRDYFRTKVTLPVEFCLEQLKKFEGLRPRLSLREGRSIIGP